MIYTVIITVQFFGDELFELALAVLRRLDPVVIAQHADIVISWFNISFERMRIAALRSTRVLFDAATLVQHAGSVIARLEDSDECVRCAAFEALQRLPRCVIRGLPLESDDLCSFNKLSSRLRSRLLGRLGWYKCRLRLRVKGVALFWYALPYRPSGPGHARDLQTWDQMNKRSRLVRGTCI